MKEQTIEYKGREYKTSLIGVYQTENLPIALQVAEVLVESGYGKITAESIRRGVKNTIWHARFEVLGDKPVFVIDGAHNDDASLTLRKSIETYFAEKKIIYIVGIFKDKDYKKVIENTIDLAQMAITFDWDNPRHLGGQELKQIIKGYMDNVVYATDIKTAVKTAFDNATEDSVIVAFGSLSHLKEIKNAYEELINGRY